jgi:hypothetical protein
MTDNIMIEVDEKVYHQWRKVEVYLRIMDNAVPPDHQKSLKIYKSNKFLIHINRKILELTYSLSIVFKHEHYLFILYEFYLLYKKKLASKFWIVELLEKIHLNEIEIKWY